MSCILVKPRNANITKPKPTPKYPPYIDIGNNARPIKVKVEEPLALPSKWRRRWKCKNGCTAKSSTATINNPGISSLKRDDDVCLKIDEPMAAPITQGITSIR